MDYKPGLISASLNQGKKKKTEASNSILTNLFSQKTEKVNKKKVSKTKKQVSQQTPLKEQINLLPKVSTSVSAIHNAENKRKIQESVKTSKMKKTKKDNVPSISSNPQGKPSNDFPFIHESLLQQSSSPKQTAAKVKKKKEMSEEEETSTVSRTGRRKRDKTADNRTLFVGNCPLTANKKTITKFFKEFGPIESIRFRCGPVAKLELPRRATMIKKDFHENATSFVCYVQYKEVESAQKALQMNGHVMDSHHIRVDLASNHKKHDKKRSIFVGNLPFTVTEEDLRSHFEDCGAIINVRIVRDRQTSIGKGIAYIQFESKDGVTLAKKLNEVEFLGRNLRVMTCTNKPVKPVNKGKNDKDRRSSKPAPKSEKKRMMFAPSNRKSSKSFEDILRAKKEKRLKKLKKGKHVAKSKKSDGLSSIFGDMSADLKKLTADNPKMRPKKSKEQKGKKHKQGKKLKKTNKP